MNNKLYQQIAATVGAYHRCIKANNTFAENHLETIERLEAYLPSGSGIDSGTKIDLAQTDDNKITLTFGYHHMNDNGMYDGWTRHKAIITPSFRGFDIRITGPNRNCIKEYLYDVFQSGLDQIVKRVTQ